MNIHHYTAVALWIIAAILSLVLYWFVGCLLAGVAVRRNECKDDDGFAFTVIAWPLYLIYLALETGPEAFCSVSRPIAKFVYERPRPKERNLPPHEKEIS